jgi:hypothetical protein
MKQIGSGIDDSIRTALEDLKKRRLADGGFAYRLGGRYRPDATAWAILILSATGSESTLLEVARSRLAKDQLPNGSIPISPDHPDVFWPTSLAILAWHGSSRHQEAKNRAVGFLLKNSGVHWKKRKDEPYRHDPSIRGWPWVANTHSWIAPTAISVIAIELAGYGQHGRVQEARRMLLDRQLSEGGWNYGNTAVYGQQLQSDAGDTGVALSALAGHVPREQISASLTYLNSELALLKTPLALGWTLLGLQAWREPVTDRLAMITSCLNRQSRYGLYDTVSLCLLLAGSIATSGLLNLAEELPCREGLSSTC